MCVLIPRDAHHKGVQTHTLYVHTNENTNTCSKQYNTKHERGLICRYSKHKGETERQNMKGMCVNLSHFKAPTNKSFCSVSPSVYRDHVSFLQFTTPQCFRYWALTGLLYASILCMVFMQMQWWQWAKTFDLGFFVSGTFNVAKASRI